VILVTSICGDFGSSICIDVSDIIRGLEDQGTFDGQHTHAFLLTNSVFKAISFDRPLYLKSIATVAELINALHKQERTWVEKEWNLLVNNGTFPKVKGHGPAFLFSLENPADPVAPARNLEDVYRQISSKILPMFIDPFAQEEFTAFASASRSVSANKKPKEKTESFNAMSIIDGNSKYDGFRSSMLNMDQELNIEQSARLFNSLTGQPPGNWRSNGWTTNQWDFCRTRPLRDFIPASAKWTDAFLQGWLLGRITGHIQLEAKGDGALGFIAKVFDVDGEAWENFPRDLLGVGALGVGNESGLNIPAALLESLPLAMALSEGDSLEPLRAYQSVTEIGASIQQSNPGAALGALFYRGRGENPFNSQIQAISAAHTLQDRIEAARGWLKAVEVRMRALADTEITMANLDEVNREYEIAPELVRAVEVIQREIDSFETIINRKSRNQL
jgi:hypothetical protein